MGNGEEHPTPSRAALRRDRPPSNPAFTILLLFFCFFLLSRSFPKTPLNTKREKLKGETWQAASSQGCSPESRNKTSPGRRKAKRRFPAPLNSRFTEKGTKCRPNRGRAARCEPAGLAPLSPGELHGAGCSLARKRRRRGFYGVDEGSLEALLLS